MFLFGKKKQAQKVSERFRGLVDWHSHILPGVDDGVADMDEALAVLRAYERLGVREVWLTPHIMEDIPNSTASLRARFLELQQAYEGNLSLRLGSENMLDGLFDERLESGDVLPLEGGRLLIETSYFTAPLAFRERVLAAKHRGFTPVLAHPERYIYMQPRDYDELKEMGVLFQQNLFSETGRYGSEARRRCLYLQQKGYYDLLGTDLHSIGALEDLDYQTRT